MSDERSDDSELDLDHHVQLAHGNVRITHDAQAGVWLVSWYPDEGVAGYPGYTYSSTSGECPNGPGLQEMVTWVMAQPWASRSGEFAAGSPTEDIATIAGQLADVTRTVEEMAKRLAALEKPSGHASQQERTKTRQERNDHGARELAELSERLQAAVDALRASIW